MEQKLKQVNDVEAQVEDHERQLKDLCQMLKDYSQSPTRSGDRTMTKHEKRDLLRKKGKILDMREVQKDLAKRSSQSPTEARRMYD